MTQRFTNADKAAEAKREVGYRRQVYARRVQDGKMTKQAADRQIACMEEIAADYAALDAKDRPDMFAEEPAAELEQPWCVLCGTRHALGVPCDSKEGPENERL